MEILIWTIVTAAAATHRRTAMFAVVPAASAAALFLAIRSAAKRTQLPVLAALLLPAAINSAITILQKLKMWNESAPVAVHAGTTALSAIPTTSATTSYRH